MKKKHKKHKKCKGCNGECCGKKRSGATVTKATRSPKNQSDQVRRAWEGARQRAIESYEDEELNSVLQGIDDAFALDFETAQHTDARATALELVRRARIQAIDCVVG